MRPSGLPGFRDGTVGQTRRVKRGPSRDLRRGRGKHRCPERVHPDASWTLGSPACRARRCALPLLGDEEPSARDSGTAEQRGSGAFVHFVFGKPSARDSGTAEQRGSGAAGKRSSGTEIDLFDSLRVLRVLRALRVWKAVSSRQRHSGTAGKRSSGTEIDLFDSLRVLRVLRALRVWKAVSSRQRHSGTVGERNSGTGIDLFDSLRVLRVLRALRVWKAVSSGRRDSGTALRARCDQRNSSTRSASRSRIGPNSVRRSRLSRTYRSVRGMYWMYTGLRRAVVW